jgi:hypothetical protein
LDALSATLESPQSVVVVGDLYQIEYPTSSVRSAEETFMSEIERYDPFDGKLGFALANRVGDNGRRHSARGSALPH